MQATIRLYYLSSGRRYIHLRLDAGEMAQLLAEGYIVKFGRWFFND